MKVAIAIAGTEHIAQQIKVSPAVWSNGFVFLTGVTGSLPSGEMPSDTEAQFHSVFNKIGACLAAAGVGFDAIVEMTSYHVGLRDHFDLFNAIRGEFVQDPFPAWTAVEVAGLRREGALVEVRVIAEAPTPPA